MTTLSRRGLLAAPALLAAPGARAQDAAAIIAAADRTPADRTNDLRRKPVEMLGFIAAQPGWVALDVSAAGGYTTELLARAIGPTGRVFGQGRPPPAAPQPSTAVPEGNARPDLAPASAPATPARRFPDSLADRSARMQAAGVAFAPITAVVRPFEDPVPPELAEAKLDLVTLIFNYHDLGHLGTDRAAMNRALFRALKPGGFYVIADHAGRPGTGISEAGTLHRIEEAFLKQEVAAAGFRLAAEGMFLRNPNDPRDRNTPDPPQPKDQFVLKFQKPS